VRMDPPTVTGGQNLAGLFARCLVAGDSFALSFVGVEMRRGPGRREQGRRVGGTCIQGGPVYVCMYVCVYVCMLVSVLCIYACKYYVTRVV
jgi:hypothetical protein